MKSKVRMYIRAIYYLQFSLNSFDLEFKYLKYKSTNNERKSQNNIKLFIIMNKLLLRIINYLG